MKRYDRFPRLIFQGVHVLGAFCALAGQGHAQVGQLAAPALQDPLLKGARPGPGGTLALPGGASVQLNQRGGYLLSAVVTVVASEAAGPGTSGSSPSTLPGGTAASGVRTSGTEAAAKLLGALSGFGPGLAQPLAQFLGRPDVVKRLPTGVKVMADPFVIGAQTQGKLLRLTLAPAQVSAPSFAAPAHVRPAQRPGATPVVLRVYSDFQCPYCEQFETKTSPGLVKQLPSDVSVEFHQFPLESIHPLARPAAEASECAAQQGQFWPFKELLFADRSWLTGNPNRAFIAFASRLGLKAEPFKTCLAERGGKAAVDTAVQEALQLGVNATPTVFVNGFRAGNPYDVASLLNLMKFARVAAAAPAAQLSPPMWPAPQLPASAPSAPRKP